MGGDLRSKNKNPIRTICEVHREIYNLLLNDSPKESIIPLLEEAFGMGKKLVNKLVYYNPNTTETTLWVDENESINN